jgi:hypothetical protein
MPGIADKFTQSARGRLLWPGMMKKSAPIYRRSTAMVRLAKVKRSAITVTK